MSTGSNALAKVADHYVGEWNALSPDTQAYYKQFKGFVASQVKQHFGIDKPELVNAIVDTAANNARATIYEEVFDAAENIFDALF